VISVKTAPKVNPRLDKIRMMATNKMIPLIYINGHYSYINKQLLKKLLTKRVRVRVEKKHGLFL